MPLKLLHPVFGKFERLAESMQPTAAALKFVQTVCAQAKYYFASEESDYQHIMRSCWRDLLLHLGAVSRPSVGRNSIPDLAMLFSIVGPSQMIFPMLVVQVNHLCAVATCSIASRRSSACKFFCDFLSTFCRHRMEWLLLLNSKFAWMTKLSLRL